MGLLSKHQVDEYLASGTPFPDVCDEAVGSADICGIETGRLDPFLPGDENGPPFLPVGDVPRTKAVW